jgi:UDP-N-acetylmuramate: L-alanyl-gamma-D-glutamyl-meso-diaminopimelate ligase
MQVRGIEAGVTVVDDFAHHPTEVAATVAAARQRWPRARLVAVFEPRTNTSRRNVFQQRYAQSFGGADRVLIVPPFDIERIPVAERFDSSALVEALRGDGLDAMLIADADTVVERLAPALAPETVVLIMSNGAFGGVHDKLLAALRARGG